MTAVRLVVATLALIASVAGVAGQDGGDDAALVDLDRRVLGTLTGRQTTPHLVVHHREDHDPALLAADVAANEASYLALEKLLAMRYRGRVHLFLYRDVADLKALTGAGGGVVAFSTGTVSVHQARDFRSVHELTHIFALQLPRPADTSGPDLFAVEGLATWLAESDEGIPIHAWAAVAGKHGFLPGLVDFKRTFPAGVAKGVHPYHVAGSFVGFLCERFGIEKVKAWYVDATEAHRWFGVGLAGREREWRAALREVTVDAEHARRIAARLGVLDSPLPEAWAKATGKAIFDGASLAGLVPEDAARWRVRDGLLVGTHAGPWTRITSAEPHGGDRVGVRLRLRLARGDAAQVRVGVTDQDRSELVLAHWSSYASQPGGGFSGNDRVKLVVGQWHDLVVVADAGRVRVWLDGVAMFDQPGAWPALAGRIEVGVEKGALEVREWVVFAPEDGR